MEIESPASLLFSDSEKPQVISRELKSSSELKKQLSVNKPLSHPALLLLAIVIMILPSCTSLDDTQPTDSETASLNRILPLGASRVEGNPPDYESFRFELWKELVILDVEFDFIGTQTDPADYPDVDGRAFDRDHQGMAGWTSGDIREAMSLWLDQTGQADIVLLSAPGGNDALENLPFNQASENILAIIEEIRQVNPEVSVIIEKMAPGRSTIMTPELNGYIEDLHTEVDRIASEFSTPESRIIPVDMFTGFSDAMLADDVHYNEEGARFVARRYMEVLIDVLQ